MTLIDYLFFVPKSVDLAYNPLNPTVQLNFKHALSRIVFKVQDFNPLAEVEVPETGPAP
ncbi:hypothetical protein AGMMS49525_10890 [Bacteroidia bacterium]|nr:hypothetical protein AGMMS49525_10890 [Bacteroidia bacterium]